MQQGSIRDLGWCLEYVFPETALGDVIRMLKINPEKDQGSDYALAGWKKFLIRMGLGNGVIKLPKNIEDSAYNGIMVKNEKGKTEELKFYRYVETRGVSIHVIGIKKDDYREFYHPQEAPDGYFQEML